MVRVLSLHAGADTAGIGWLLTQAFRADPDVLLRSAARTQNYIQYPHDLAWGQVADVASSADVIHGHNAFKTWRLFGMSKPLVLHHHGTYYRENAEALNRAVAETGSRAVVATLDLLDYGDDLTWCPAPYDLPWLASFRHEHDGPLRVGHAPTDRSIKATDAFLSACDRLGIEPVLIERQSWLECLRVKGTIDVLFDQVQLGYGHNAIEAWGMGIPVIAGADDSTLVRMRDTFGMLPFYEATEATIVDALTAMRDADVRAEYSARGLDHVRRWHDGTETRRVLKPIYARLTQ